MLRTNFALALWLGMTWAALADDGEYQAVFFSVSVATDSRELNRGYESKSFKDMTYNEAQKAADAACSLYTKTKCAVTNAAENMKLGFIDINVKKGAHEWQGAFRAPDGYKICKVAVNKRSGENTLGAAFNGTLQDDRHQWAYYASAQAEPRDWVKYMVYARILPNDKTETADCMNDGLVWMCGTHCAAKQYEGVADFDDGYKLRR
jgi:hypothetical protein